MNGHLRVFDKSANFAVAPISGLTLKIFTIIVGKTKRLPLLNDITLYIARFSFVMPECNEGNLDEFC